MKRPSTPRSSRRAVLAACGTGLVSLAGCIEADLDLGRGDDATYDVSRLSDVAMEEPPTRPDAFPVAITGELLDRHYDRARELVSTVPKRPAIPNDVVARRLGEERTRVIEALDEDRADDETGLQRLSSARSVRDDAAEVDGAYRAATGEIDHGAVTEREERLRADLLSFEAAWDYRGDTPARALVVHAELEDLRDDVRRDAEAWPPIPPDPASAPFQVGERIRNLESGRAAIGDADRLRTAYLEGADDPRSFRAAITAAAHRLEDRARWDQRWVHGYLDTRPGDLPFDRSLSNTPAEALYSAAQRHANAHVDVARRILRDGDHASAVLASVRGLASLGTLDDVVDAIRAGEYGRPEDVEVVATAHEAAVAAVEASLGTEPVPVSAEGTFPALEAIESGRYYLERADGDGRGVHRALGEFAFARRYAEALPSAVEAAVDALAEAA